METDGEKAVRLLNAQLKELESVRGLNHKDPVFLGWRDTTSALLQRFLPPGSPHTTRFQNLAFTGRVGRRQPWGSPPRPTGYISPQDQGHYIAECRTAEATIRQALKHIEEFGVPADQSLAKPSRGGVQQNFYGNVTIESQAIATDNAIQMIGHMRDTIGSSLKEIADLLQQSEELTPRQVREGLGGIETLAVEVQKPEAKRNWKSVLEYGQAVLGIADKATDLAHKLALHTPTIVALVQGAKHALGM
jgi:hypothetical protein